MLKDKNVNLALFPTDPEEYGAEFRGHLLHQYSLYVTGAQQVSDRRERANAYFGAISAALFTLIALSFQIQNDEVRAMARAVIGIGGVCSSVLFWLLLRSYRQLNSAKFHTIAKIEKWLPLSPYAYEWEALTKNRSILQTYIPFSRVEGWILSLFAVGYLFLLLQAIYVRVT